MGKSVPRAPSDPLVHFCKMREVLDNSGRAPEMYDVQGVSTKFTGSWYTVLYYELVNLDETPCTLRLKSLYTFASVWSKTTLLTGSLGGA